MKIFTGPVEESELVRKLNVDRRNSLFLFYASMLSAPILAYALLWFNVISPKPIVETDIQESVVQVFTENAQGTGFFINDSQLLTAKHVIEGYAIGDQCQIELSRENIIDAKVIYIPSNENFDFAVLECIEPTNVKNFFTLGNSEEVELYDQTILTGFPSGVFQSMLGSVSSKDWAGDENYISLASAGFYGASGGTIVSKSNPREVIGILTGGIAGSGLVYALKIERVKDDNGFIKVYRQP